MSATFDAPILVCLATLETPLTLAASDLGWVVIFGGELTERERFRVAVVQSMSSDRAAKSDALRQRFPNAVFMGAPGSADADFELSSDAPEGFLAQLLGQAERYMRKGEKVNELANDVGLRRQRMHQLNEISLALTDQMSQQDLLTTILSEARRIAGCEAGSLFLVEPDPIMGESLVFKLAQNDAVNFPFEETRLPLSSDSIVGYVAVTGHELNIRNVYELADDLPYRFNSSYDDKMDYRTRSMLTLPMRDHRERVVGVLQFLNKRRDTEVGPEIVHFGEEIVEILRAIASQAAVSLQKNALLEDINQLFESFVQASVKTIEQRDPSTSGHSFRVAETTVALLQALPESGVSAFRGLELSNAHLREVRYAALLHDFGKIGVPEAVLVKANKLTDERLEILRYRIELQKERLRRRAVEQELELLHHGPVDFEVARRRVHTQLGKQEAILDQYYECIVNANNPNVLDAGDFEHLSEIRSYAFRELDGTVGGVITDDDVLALSVRRGSLTPVRAPRDPGARGLHQGIPLRAALAAGAHGGARHRGCPPRAHGRQRLSRWALVGEQIPLASRVMAVCDVYDALTAMDRPYKPAMSMDTAFSILTDEARRGLLDADMVSVFIDSGSYLIAEAV